MTAASPTPPGSHGPEGARDGGVQGGAGVLPAPRRGLRVGERWRSLERSRSLIYRVPTVCQALSGDRAVTTTNTLDLPGADIVVEGHT